MRIIFERADKLINGCSVYRQKYGFLFERKKLSFFFNAFRFSLNTFLNTFWTFLDFFEHFLNIFWTLFEHFKIFLNIFLNFFEHFLNIFERFFENWTNESSIQFWLLLNVARFPVKFMENFFVKFEHFVGKSSVIKRAGAVSRSAISQQSPARVLRMFRQSSIMHSPSRPIPANRRAKVYHRKREEISMTDNFLMFGKGKLTARLVGPIVPRGQLISDRGFMPRTQNIHTA